MIDYDKLDEYLEKFGVTYSEIMPGVWKLEPSLIIDNYNTLLELGIEQVIYRVLPDHREEIRYILENEDVDTAMSLVNSIEPVKIDDKLINVFTYSPVHPAYGIDTVLGDWE